MTDSTTATVVTITAEVRQLVVGSRQITAGVYNQLDRVAPGHIEPMGRVTPKDGRHDYVYVVGKHAETADLVASSCPVAEVDIERAAMNASDVGRFENAIARIQDNITTRIATAERAEEDAEERLTGTGYNSVARREETMAEAEASVADASTEVEQLKFLARAAEWRYQAASMREEGEDYAEKARVARKEAKELSDKLLGLASALEQAKIAYADDLRARMILAERWSALPLIVLAGLR